MKKPTTWAIVALSVIVLVQAVIIFRVWPAEYYYTKMGQFPVNGILDANAGWREATNAQKQLPPAVEP